MPPMSPLSLCFCDKAAVLACMRRRGASLADVAPHLKVDVDVVLNAVRQHGGALRLAPSFQGCREVVLAAIGVGPLGLCLRLETKPPKSMERHLAAL